MSTDTEDAKTDLVETRFREAFTLNRDDGSAQTFVKGVNFVAPADLDHWFLKTFVEAPKVLETSEPEAPRAPVVEGTGGQTANEAPAGGGDGAGGPTQAELDAAALQAASDAQAAKDAAASAAKAKK